MHRLTCCCCCCCCCCCWWWCSCYCCIVVAVVDVGVAGCSVVGIEDGVVIAVVVAVDGDVDVGVVGGGGMFGVGWGSTYTHRKHAYIISQLPHHFAPSYDYDYIYKPVHNTFQNRSPRCNLTRNCDDMVKRPWFVYCFTYSKCHCYAILC